MHYKKIATSPSAHRNDTIRVFFKAELLLFFLIIAIVYSPVLYFNYVFHDDGSFWIKVKEYGFNHIFFDMSMSRGRYGTALLLNLENLFVHKASDLTFLRFLSVGVSSGIAYILLLQMRRLFFSDIQAFLIISAMIFLPGFAAIIFYSISASIFTLCIFLACWSFHRIETGKGMVTPALSFLFAITIYPSAAMFYWTMTGMYILFVQDRSGMLFRKNIFRMMAVGLTGMFIYAISIYLMHFSYVAKIESPLYNPYVITHDWGSKLQWFFQEPMGNALNLWDIFPKMTASIIVSGFVAFTALVVITREGIALNELWQFFLFIVVFFLTFSPNLAAQGNAAFYRCLVPLSSLIWLILVWAIFKWRGICPRVLTKRNIIALFFIVVVFAGISTFRNVLYYRVLPSHIEWNAFKMMAKEIHLKKKDAIHIILPNHDLTKERYDEFGVLSSHYTPDIYQMTLSALNEVGALGQIFPLLYFSYPGDDNLIIELNESFIEKSPDGKWVGRDINKTGQFHEVDAPLSTDRLDRELIYEYSPQPIFSKRQNWDVLNLNDFFSPSNVQMSLEKDPELAQAYNNRSTLYTQRGDLTQALSDLNKSIEINPELTEAYFNRGNVYYRQNNLTQAIDDYVKVIKINPRFEKAYTNLIAVYSGLKEFDKAWSYVNKAQEAGYLIDPTLIKTLKASSELKNKDAKNFNNRGVANVKRGNFSQAFTDFNKAIELDPNFAEAYNNRSNLFVQRGDFTRALSDLNKSIKINPDFEGAYFNRGNIYYWQNNLTQAIDDYVKVIKLNPLFEKGYTNLIVVYSGLKEFDKAWVYVHKAQEAGLSLKSKLIEALKVLSGINVKEAKAFSRRGIDDAQHGNFSQAFADFNRAIEIDHDFAEAYSNRSNLFAQKGDFTDALFDLDKAIEINPSFAKAYFNRAIVYHRQNNFNQAIADYTKAIKLKPLYRKAYINLIAVYYELKEIDKAQDYVHKAQEAGISLNSKLIKALKDASGN